MKFKISLLALALFAFSHTSTAQIDVTINPIGILWGDLNLAGEYIVQENFGVELQAGYNSRSVDINGEEAWKFSGVPISLLGKYYFSPNLGADKFYGLIFTRYVSRSYKYQLDDSNSEDYSLTRFGLGVGAGWKWASEGGVILDFNLGVGRAFVNDADTQEGAVIADIIDLMIIGKLGVGYRFGGK